MNVGVFSDLYHPIVNGTVTSISTFELELERRGHGVEIFAPATMLFGRLGPERKQGHVHRFHSIGYPPFPGYRVSFPLYRPMRSELERLKLDVLHSHSPFSLGIFASRVSSKHDVPHVHTCHTRWPEYARHYVPGCARWNERAMRACVRVFSNRVTRLIAPSEAMRDRLRDEGIHRPIDVLPTPIADDAFGVSDAGRGIRRRHGIAPGAPLLLTVARLGHEKSIDYLLRSFARVAARNRDARLLIIGDGPARSELEALAAALGVRERVVFAGEVKARSDVLRAYAAADVFVYAARTDTQCLTLLEAAAAGLPLVARWDAPLASALEPGVNGTFVEGGESDHAEAVMKILESPDLARGYRRESVRIARGHDVKTRCEQLLAIYDRARGDHA